MEFIFDEILLEIFSYLDSKDLLNVMVVSRRFNKLVSTSPRLMEKITLKIDFKNIFWNCFGREVCLDKSIDALMSSKRVYQNILLVNVWENGIISKLWEQVDEFLRKFRNNLKHIRFVDCEFSTVDLIEMLYVLPNINKISFQRVVVGIRNDIEETLQAHNKVFQLSNLRELEIKYCTMSHYFFYIFVHVENLEILSVKNYEEYAYEDDIYHRSEYASLEKFLCQQNSLQVLEFDSALNSKMFNKSVEKSIKFQLSKLTVKNFMKAKLENTVKFLKTQKKLKSFEIDLINSNNESVDEILNFILGLSFLENLRLNVIVSDKFKYEIKNIDSIHYFNDNLKHLSIDYYNQNRLSQGIHDWNEHSLFKYLVGVFPNVNKFSLFYYLNSSGAGLLKVSDLEPIEKWKHLEELEIETIGGPFLSKLKFENLKKLKCCLKDITLNDWETFVRNNDGIKSLEIEINSIDNSTINLITKQLKQLEVLSISSFCFNLNEINEATIIIVCKNCEKLKKLKLELPSSCEYLKLETVQQLKSKVGLDYRFLFYKQSVIQLSR